MDQGGGRGAQLEGREWCVNSKCSYIGKGKRKVETFVYNGKRGGEGVHNYKHYGSYGKHRN